MAHRQGRGWPGPLAPTCLGAQQLPGRCGPGALLPSRLALRPRRLRSLGLFHGPQLHFDGLQLLPAGPHTEPRGRVAPGLLLGGGGSRPDRARPQGPWLLRDRLGGRGPGTGLGRPCGLGPCHPTQPCRGGQPPYPLLGRGTVARERSELQPWVPLNPGPGQPPLGSTWVLPGQLPGTRPAPPSPRETGGSLHLRGLSPLPLAPPPSCPHSLAPEGASRPCPRPPSSSSSF